MVTETQEYQPIWVCTGEIGFVDRKGERRMKVKIPDIKTIEELYPRNEVDKKLVEAYGLNLEELPPIVVSKDMILVDGQHRLMAHTIAKEKEIEAEILDITDKKDIFREAIKRNARHGKQFTIEEKQRLAKQLLKTGDKVKAIASDLGVSRQFVEKWTKAEREEENEGRNKRILEAYLKCETQEAIAEKENVVQKTVSNVIDTFSKNATDSKITIDPNLYDVWNYNTNDDKYGFKDYPGRIPGQFIEQLLHRYTEPFDVVIDPFAGSGTTIDVCKAMLRCYRAYDIEPVSDEIQKWNIAEGYPEGCKGCNLIFLDPPYYKKKKEEYGEGSISALSQKDYLSFFEKLAKDSYEILKKGGYLTFLMSNYIDYDNDSGSTFVYQYVNYFVQAGFIPVIEIQCPLSTQQYTGFQVNQAKILEKILIRSRSLFIFRK